MKLNTLLITTIVTSFSAVSSHAILIFGLDTAGVLVSFDSAAPNVFTDIGSPAGGIVEIDFRGSNQKLYGLSGSGESFTISTTNGSSTFLNTPVTALTGTVSGFDVNPVPDRFRVVAAGVNNYRLTTGGMDTNAVTVDNQFLVPNGVTLLDVAYTNPFTGGSTTLYSITSDGNLNSHSGPPQFNTLAVVGATGIVLGTEFGFDISTEGIAYASSDSLFYTVNLATGLATPAGVLARPLTSFSAIPEPSSALLVGLAGLGLLRRRR
ncbi:MAG: DUF4394 domain-containing protein [Armatimonadetes bacterium]|nr:DUF4394 domain-containing protein [Akkermansiaceae bacterium]